MASVERAERRGWLDVFVEDVSLQLHVRMERVPSPGGGGGGGMLTAIPLRAVFITVRWTNE